MTDLVEENFAVETPKGNFPAKCISTDWAKGFNCKSKPCGLCCITELPDGVPKKNLKIFDEVICGHFNVEKRICEAYEQRPWGCRTYPFIFGVQDGQVIVSPSVECPSTNESKLDLGLLKDTFRNSLVGLTVYFMDAVFREAKGSHFWNSAEAYWEFIEYEINEYLDSHTNFPLLYDLSEFVYESIDRYFGTNMKHPKLPEIYQLIPAIANGKSVISTNFHTYNMYYARIQKFKIHLIAWNPFTGEIKRIKTRLATKPQQLEIKKDGMQLLRDYISLLFKRPFLSLAAIQLTALPKMIPSFLASDLIGSFVHLEVAANLFSYKLLGNGIDRSSMRELLSFADGCLLSQFRNPVGSMHLK